MKTKNTSVFNQKNIHLSQFKNKHKYQILENYWKKKKKEWEKSFKILLTDNYEFYFFFFISICDVDTSSAVGS